MKRLQFLARWSEFIEREGISSEQQGRGQLAFEEVQDIFLSAETRLARLTANHLIPNPALGSAGELQALQELLRYTRLKEYENRLNGAEFRPRSALAEALGEVRASAGFRADPRTAAKIFRASIAGPGTDALNVHYAKFIIQVRN